MPSYLDILDPNSNNDYDSLTFEIPFSGYRLYLVQSFPECRIEYAQDYDNYESAEQGMTRMFYQSNKSLPFVPTSGGDNNSGDSGDNNSNDSDDDEGYYPYAPDYIKAMPDFQALRDLLGDDDDDIECFAIIMIAVWFFHVIRQFGNAILVDFLYF